MKLLPSGLIASTSEPITTPLYLIELEFSTTLYLSSRQAVVYGGQLYSKNGVTVKSGSEYTAVLGLDNTDLSATAIVLGEGVRDKPVRIYAAYGSGGSLTSNDVTLVFDGYMGNVSAMNHVEVEIQCYYSAEVLDLTPRIYCTPPLCNHVPPTGTKLGSYTLEAK